MSNLRPALTREQVQAAFGAMSDAKDHFYREARPLMEDEISIVKALQQSMDDIETALWNLVQSPSREESGAAK